MSSELEVRKDKSKKKAHSEASRPSWQKTFIECSLTKEDKSKCKAALSQPEVVLERFNHFLLDGYKVSFAYESRSDAVGAYATMPDESHPAYMLCISSRGPDLLSALSTLMYKHYVLLDGTWLNEAVRTKERDQWD